MRIVVLGSTGSIGKNVLEVTDNIADIEVYGISTNKDIESFYEQIKKYSPKYGVIADESAYDEFMNKIATENLPTKLIRGKEGLSELVLRKEIDVIVNGLSGIAGLKPTILALSIGKKVATANKESIIMGWNLIKDNIQFENQLIPIDSEHSAIFQCLKGEKKKDVYKLILTASGGAVYNKTFDELKMVTVEDCLIHPTWDMGTKITIDSATLMNKGIEVIEAHNLFSFDYTKIDVLIHPQSIVHGLIELIDGTMLASLATQDMKVPIQYALSHPDRYETPSNRLRVEDLSELTFLKPDYEKFPCLKLAVEAGKQGGIAPIILCAADEVAVENFMKGKISFTDIPVIISKVLDKEIDGSAGSPDEIEYIYRAACGIASRLIN